MGKTTVHRTGGIARARADGGSGSRSVAVTGGVGGGPAIVSAEGSALLTLSSRCMGISSDCTLDAVTRRTRILATIGPSSNTTDAIGQLIAAGADAFRLNFSHGTRDSHAVTCRRIREAAERWLTELDTSTLRDLLTLRRDAVAADVDIEA